MKRTTAALLMALGLTLPAAILTAQDQAPPPRVERPARNGGARPDEGPGGDRGPSPDQDGPRRPPPEGENSNEGRRPPRPVPPPLMVALDLNGDGEIDAEEIAKASESLKKLDKNHDGKLSADELRPLPPRGDARRPQGGGPGGFGAKGGPEGRPNRGDRPVPPDQAPPVK